MLYSILIALWSNISLPGDKEIYLSVRYEPYQNQIVVTYQVPREATLYVCDAIGVVYHKISLLPNQKQILFDSEQLAEGPYWALLYLDNQLVTIKRFIVQKT